MIRRIFSILCAAVIALSVYGQGMSVAPDRTIEWTVSAERADNGNARLVFKGKILDGWHVYDLENKYNPTSVEIVSAVGATADGTPYEISESTDYYGDPVFFGEIVLGQDFTLTGENPVVEGTVTWTCCSETICAQPEYFDFKVTLPSDESVSAGASQASASASGEEGGKGGVDWALILEAILWGFAALLTPCVFPMVPMTVSFFLKGSSSPAAGRFKAFMYGLFIILLYTVPISLIILITRMIGGDTVTADIFNWLATHWIPNIIFFVVFMIFAASFLGAFEIVLPSSLANKSNKGAGKGGLLGIFFMALTLVLVSFSCTGPIVGTVLIKSTEGEFWTPMVTMLAFSLAFALPFTLLALFPSLLNKMKSGSWMNTVKVILGFVEIALGFKFLSVADQTYHWGLLDREIYLAIWITVFSLLGLYLLGKLRFAHDAPVDHVSVPRLAGAIAVFAFVVYMIPGLFGAPLKALSGYLPPMTSQDFVLGSTPAANTEIQQESEYGLHLPLGLTGYFDLEEGLAAAKEAGKPVFVDITGHGCVNCREMESRVWSDPQVLDILRNDYVIVALYTDDKGRLKEEDWVTTVDGKVLKHIGRANSYIARTRFGVNAQPNYILLSPDGEMLAPFRGYDLSIPGFVEFLNSGLGKMADQSPKTAD